MIAPGKSAQRTQPGVIAKATLLNLRPRRASIASISGSQAFLLANPKTQALNPSLLGITRKQACSNAALAKKKSRTTRLAGSISLRRLGFLPLPFYSPDG